MNAIVRHLNSGEHFLATLDDSGDVLAMSAALPIVDATDRETGDVNYETFADADTAPFEEDADRRFWTADRIAVVYSF